MILFFDTESTGLVDFNLRPSHSNQPDLVQLALLLTEDDGTERLTACMIVHPDGYTIPDEAVAIHGIDTALATAVGVSLKSAVRLFRHALTRASLVVAHNLAFDERVLDTALIRCGEDNGIQGAIHGINETAQKFCTMKAATPVCKIPHAKPRRANDYKWPKLTECYRQFFDEDLAGAHDALADARACKRVYFHLRGMKEQTP